MKKERERKSERNDKQGEDRRPSLVLLCSLVYCSLLRLRSLLCSSSIFPRLLASTRARVWSLSLLKKKKKRKSDKEKRQMTPHFPPNSLVLSQCPLSLSPASFSLSLSFFLALLAHLFFCVFLSVENGDRNGGVLYNWRYFHRAVLPRCPPRSPHKK